MDAIQINTLDLVVGAVLLLSALVAFWRGFVKEVLLIVALVVAGVAAWKGYGLVQPYLEPHLGDERIAAVTGGGLVFLLALIVLSVIFNLVIRLVRQSEIGALDRALGFLFGLARGAALIALAYLILVQLVPPQEHPDWVREARTLPAVQYGARLLLAATPPAIAGQLVPVEGERPKSELDAIPLLPRPAPTDSTGETGYKPDDRRQLDRLFGTSQEER